MNILKELPAGTIWSHLLEAIERQVVTSIRVYARARQHEVSRGAESPALAALLVEKYGGGMAGALSIAGIDSTVQAETDSLVHQIDPDFDVHKKAREEARPAAVTFEKHRLPGQDKPASP